VRERNQVGCPLRRLDRRDPRHAEDIPLLRRPVANHSERRGRHRDTASGTRDPLRDFLRAHVDHVRLP